MCVCVCTCRVHKLEGWVQKNVSFSGIQETGRSANKGDPEEMVGEYW